MTFRGYAAIIILVVAIIITASGTFYLYKITNSLSSIIDEGIEFITNKQYEKAEKEYIDFTELYNKNKMMLSVFINDNHIKSINLSVEKLSETFESNFEETLLTEFKELSENVKNIYNDYKISIESIF